MILILIMYPVAEIWLTSKFVGQYGWVNFLFVFVISLMVGRIGWRHSQLRTAAAITGLQREDRHSVAKFLQPALGVLGSVLLFLPGVLGDAIGILMVFPPTGFLIARVFEGYFYKKIHSGEWHVGSSGIIFQAQSRGGPKPSDIIDVESRPIRDVTALNPSDDPK